MKRYSNVILILAAGALWGLMGTFSRGMNALGFSSSGVVIVRCGSASVFFFLTLLLRDRSLFRIRLRDLWCFLGSGLCSLLFFTYCYFQAITLTSLSTAAILLYTAPSMVMLMSLVLFHEKITAQKVLALVMAFAGCALVSGLGSGKLALSVSGLIYGLCSGFGYALYSIFARFAMNRGYKSLTINFYSCLLATLGAAVIWGATEPLQRLFSGWQPLAVGLSMGLVACYFPYLFYTKGLEGTEAGKASVMASVEPVVATICGFVFFHEKLTALGLLGVLLVLGAVVMLNIRLRHKKDSRAETGS